MFTSDSQKFSSAFKNKALAAIECQIKKHDSMSTFEFAKIMPKWVREDDTFQVKCFGYRWKNPEQCYQAMIMRLSEKLRQKRGPGFMTDKEAAALEAMFLLPTTGYMFDEMAKEAVAAAAETDHWYMLEKSWD